MLGKSSLARGKCLPYAHNSHYFCGTISHERAPGWQVGADLDWEGSLGSRCSWRRPRAVRLAETSQCESTQDRKIIEFKACLGYLVRPVSIATIVINEGLRSAWSF